VSIFPDGLPAIQAGRKSTNRVAPAGALEQVTRIVERIRQAWLRAQILLRGRSGKCLRPLKLGAGVTVSGHRIKVAIAAGRQLASSTCNCRA
jgi:hypothetical protein